MATSTVKLNRDCDLCKAQGRTSPAIADVKLNYAWGGTWAYVCNTHYSERANDTYVTKLERES